VKNILKFKSSLNMIAFFVIFYSIFANVSIIVQAEASESADIQPTAQERKMLKLVNAARGERKLSPLAVDLQLTKIARLKAEDMIANGYFAHHSPTYGSPFEMMKSFGVTYTSAGENIAENRTVAGAHSALMLSNGHRANILNERFNRIGIGIIDGPREFITIVQMFVQSAP